MDDDEKNDEGLPPAIGTAGVSDGAALADDLAGAAPPPSDDFDPSV